MKIKLFTKKNITINGIIKTYQQWSLYFGYNHGYVSNRVKKFGLESTIEYLTKLYWEKQKQESTQKDNIAA